MGDIPDVNGGGEFDPALYQEILKAVREANDKITVAENGNKKSLDDLKSSAINLEASFGGLRDDHKGVTVKLESLEASVNDLWKRNGRPGQEATPENIKERANAIELLRMKHEMAITKKDESHPFKPTEEQIKSAIEYRK